MAAWLVFHYSAAHINLSEMGLSVRDGNSPSISSVPTIMGLAFQIRSNDPGSIHISPSSLFDQLYILHNHFSMNSPTDFLSKIEFWGNIYIFSPHRQHDRIDVKQRQYACP